MRHALALPPRENDRWPRTMSLAPAGLASRNENTCVEPAPEDGVTDRVPAPVPVNVRLKLPVTSREKVVASMVYTPVAGRTKLPDSAGIRELFPGPPSSSKAITSPEGPKR